MTKHTMYTMNRQFWIDIGGTFTDIIARKHNGKFLYHKTLSSGIVKGRIVETRAKNLIFDPLRTGNPEGFWQGFQFCLVDAQGNDLLRTVVIDSCSTSGTLTLDSSFSQALPRFLLEPITSLEQPNKLRSLEFDTCSA